LEREFRSWDYQYKYGCQDPFWPDGVNLNLVRNHIIALYKELADKILEPVQLSLFDFGVEMSNERPIPQEVPNDYMAPQGKFPHRIFQEYRKKEETQ